MNRWQQIRRVFVAFLAVFLLTTSVACSTATPEARTTSPSLSSGNQYGELARGDSAQGDRYADWVIQTSHGLIKDAYVRDNDKLGVVISKDVRPDDVKPLARSLVQGFHRSSPNRDLSVLVYAPDKQLILTARYNQQTQQVNYQG
ncbi:hypothetical protein [Leptolyngbya ohadii]|uniref:hypothetical protein n=1 Tax=Leptolyngbya ohadii TaxID=1962290 RepID=UPI000B59B6C0|nr:hypothetical protein [Leptolyngbya ohadii]